ncbi:unnamed protein product [Urochloa decumbens]|uniref:Uncharacterized protein n=1 Tax=Urochloa decumbens TaxID=240449 RepID=A0ABC9AZ94_9POAL
MESYATKLPEASGEEGEMARGTTKSLKAAAAAAAAIGPHGLFAGFSAKGKAGQEAAASSVEQAFAMAAVATAMAQKAMEAAQQATVLAAAASKQADVEKQSEEADQAEEEEQQQAAADTDTDTDAYGTDSEDEGEGMTSMEYIMAYKELPPFEVELILRVPVQRTLFAETEAYKAMIADPSTTQDDIDKASDEHEENQNMRVRFHDYVRREYEAKGYVAVSDEYIARRARTEEFSRKLWEEGFSDSDSEDDAKEGAH